MYDSQDRHKDSNQIHRPSSAVVTSTNTRMLSLQIPVLGPRRVLNSAKTIHLFDNSTSANLTMRPLYWFVN